MKVFRDMFLIFRKDLKHYWRWKLHLIFDVIVPLLDLALLILVWGAVIKGGFESVSILTKENYVAYFLSGFIVWGFIRISFGRDISHSFIHEKHWRTIQYLLFSPIKRIAIPYGTVIMPFIRAIYSSSIILLIGILFFGFTIQGNIFLIFLIVFLTFLGFSGIGLIIAGLASWREDFADISWLIEWVLSIASGLFFPLGALPKNIYNTLMFLPSSQAVNAIRLIALEGVGIFQLLPIILNLTIFSIISMTLAVLVFKYVDKKAMLIGI